MVERRGRYGMFKSCSDYPTCPGPKREKATKGVEA
jgi:ssDNA-binding Zn-finger/Zn-ribbon topoisomerase 1